MWSILRVVLLILTSIGLPAKIEVVDCLNKQVSLICWYMLVMCIESHMWLSFLPQEHILFIWWTWSLFFSLGHWLSILLLDFCNSCTFISIFFNTLLNVEMLGLFTNEALNSVTLKAFTTVLFLNETYHCFTTFGIKRSIWASLNTWKLSSSISKRISALLWDDIVSEISDKSQSIVKFNFHCLIVNSTPASANWLTSHLCCNSVSIVKSYFPSFGLWEGELMIFTDNLNSIWSSMCAQFVGVEYIYILSLSINLEFPFSENVIFEAMNRLVSLYKGVVVVNEAQDGQTLDGFVEHLISLKYNKMVYFILLYLFISW